MAYDKKFRERAIAFKEGGATFVELKAVFGIDRKTFFAWTKLRDETGDVVPNRPPQVRRRKIDKEKLKLAVLKNPDAYLEELAKPFNCSIPAVFYALKKMGITQKKDVHLRRKIRRKTGKFPEIPG